MCAMLKVAGKSDPLCQSFSNHLLYTVKPMLRANHQIVYPVTSAETDELVGVLTYRVPATTSRPSELGSVQTYPDECMDGLARHTAKCAP